MTLRTRSTIVALALVLALPPATIAAQQARPGVRMNSPASLGIHGFSVVLVVGSLSGAGGAASDGVPEAAKKALTDMRDFLPYKRYQLLDAAWMLCCSSLAGSISGRVRGPDERDYRYSVDPLTVTDSKLNVRFAIRESTPTSAGSTHASEVGLARDHPRMIESTRAQNIIDSTFSISLGETVVVGTSRLNGDRALIAILTAAGKPTAAR
jgi:hypothetical protein